MCREGKKLLVSWDVHSYVNTLTLTPCRCPLNAARTARRAHPRIRKLNLILTQ